MMVQKTTHDSETPKIGQQVITACAFIYQDFDGIKKVFMPRRALTKNFLPGVYELPGGHIDFGEDIVEGLKREIREEFNMDIIVGEPYAAFTYINEIKGAHAIEVVYRAYFAGDLNNIMLDPDDHESFMWVGEHEIDLIMTENKRGDDPEICAIRKGFAQIKPFT